MIGERSVVGERGVIGERGMIGERCVVSGQRVGGERCVVFQWRDERRRQGQRGGRIAERSVVRGIAVAQPVDAALFRGFRGGRLLRVGFFRGGSGGDGYGQQ